MWNCNFWRKDSSLARLGLLEEFQTVPADLRRLTHQQQHYLISCALLLLEKQIPASAYAVAVGKLYRPWDDQHDESQKSDVQAVHLPLRFQGSQTNFADDIAVVIAASTFVYKTSVKPVCLSFHIDKKQLQNGDKGKITGLELTNEKNKLPAMQKVKDHTYVDVVTCITEAPAFFREYITADKICARKIDSPLCKGDGGSGLVFPSLVNGIERYYLRGIASTAPTSDDVCFPDAFATIFTDVLKHEDFIKQFWTEQQ